MTAMNPRLTTLCYIEKDGCYLVLHRTRKDHDENHDKWIGVGGKFEPGESPEECLLRETREETGLMLTDYRFRGLITFVSDEWGVEYMHLYTATGFTGEITPCNEGELVWLPKAELLKKKMWAGDRLFLKALDERDDFFTLKLVYRGEDLVEWKFGDDADPRSAPSCSRTGDRCAPGEGDVRAVKALPREKLLELIDIYAKNWLAMDGVWFQSIERKLGMDEAMHHDAEAWRRFTVIEATRIKAFLGLPERAGVAGLAQALRLRFYANINADRVEVDGNVVTYTAVDCRVQTARKRKGMPFHPCKSVGLIEYAGFAQTIDDRFTCECVSCYPDITDATCCCKWRFTLHEEAH